MFPSVKVSHKLLMIYAMDMVASIFLGYILVKEKYLSIDFARKELAGLELIDATRRTLGATVAYDFAQRRPGAVGADQGSAAEAIRQERMALVRLEQARGQGMDATDLIQSAATASLSGAEQIEVAINRLRAVISRVGDMSNLILDPDLDSYYTMSLTILRYPELIEILVRLDHRLSGAAGNGHLDNASRADLLLLEGRLAGVAQDLDSDLTSGLRSSTDGSLEAGLAVPHRQLSAALAETMAAMHDVLSAEAVSRADGIRLSQFIQRSVASSADAWLAASRQLQRLLHLRIDGFFYRMAEQFATTGVLLLVILAAVLVVARRISKPIGALAAAADRVRLTNDYSVRVQWDSGDEIGRLATAFNRMVEGLESGDEAKRLLAELKAAQAKLIENNAALEKASRLVLDGIGYARKIQDGLLPDVSSLGDAVADFHVSWKPLQQVGGDYYWLHRQGSRALILLADCTGHGVPGAFMTVVVASALDRILVEGGSNLSPAQILERLDEAVRQRLRQDRSDGHSDDGLDASVCLWDGETRTLTFSGANMPLLICAAGRVETIKGDRRSLGYRTGLNRRPFTDQTIAVEPGTTIYMFTDGMTDHVGGLPPMLFGRRRLSEVIAANANLPLPAQIERIEAVLAHYRGDQHPRDDMAIIAFRPL